MKSFLLCILVILSGAASAQIIDNPSFKVRSGSITNITRIERTPKETRLSIHAIFRPHWWIKESGKSFLQDVKTGEKYAFLKAEGIELSKEVYMPDSGQMDYTLIFEPLPKGTKEIDYIDPEDAEGKIYGISLAAEKKKKSLFSRIKGNWYKTDNPNSWGCGIYDSITIMQNQIYTNEEIRTKRKCIEMTIKNKKNGKISNLRVIPSKKNSCIMQINNNETLHYTKQETFVKKRENEADFSTFFHTDTATIQGYIDGYHPCLGFDTSMLYLSNELTREDYPTVIKIQPNGTFERKFILSHPIENSICLNNAWFPFYIEPGQTLTMYINWEAVLAYNRARDSHYPIKDLHYMGPSSELSQMYQGLSKVMDFSYNKLNQYQKELTPKQFKREIQDTFSRWEQAADSIIAIYASSPKAIHLIKNKLKLKKGTLLLDFIMNRKYLARKDTTNQILKINAESSYYNFLKNISLEDQTLLADHQCNVFINRFEYMEPLTNAYLEQYRPNEEQPKKTQPSNEEQERKALDLFQKYIEKGELLIQQLSNQQNPLLWQVSLVRRLQSDLKNYKTRSAAQKHTDFLKARLTHPALIAETERMLEVTHPQGIVSSYQLPQGRATDIFRNIIKEHQNKVLFIDFWATTCSPCRYGIEHMADLRKKYKNHPEFQFIYITSEEESPKEMYVSYVNENLNGEVSYRINKSDFHYLRQLFKFNGIPHYELIEKDGSVALQTPDAYQVSSYLKTRFGE